MEANTVCKTKPSNQTMPHKVEQRQHARQLSQIEVEFSSTDCQLLHTLAENISLGGAWLTLSVKQPDIGTVGKLHARIDNLNLYMMAKVVRKNSIGIGVTFVDMGFETYDRLKKIMQHMDNHSE